MTGRAASYGAAFAAALVLGLGGCGGDGAGTDLSPAAARVLAADVDAVTRAARAGDRGALQTALVGLRRHVEEQERAGELSGERAARILAAAARVSLDVGAPSPKVVVSTAPAPRGGGDGGDEGVKDEGGKDEDKDEGDGKDEDKDEDDGKQGDGKDGDGDKGG